MGLSLSFAFDENYSTRLEFIFNSVLTFQERTVQNISRTGCWCDTFFSQPSNRICPSTCWQRSSNGAWKKYPSENRRLAPNSLDFTELASLVFLLSRYINGGCRHGNSFLAVRASLSVDKAVHYFYPVYQQLPSWVFLRRLFLSATGCCSFGFLLNGHFSILPLSPLDCFIFSHQVNLPRVPSYYANTPAPEPVSILAEMIIRCMILSVKIPLNRMNFSTVSCYH